MRLGIWAIAAILLAATAGARAQEGAGNGGGIPYRAEVVGVEDSDLRGRIENNSRLIQLEKEPPASLAALSRRAADDRERVQTVLRSEGYYDGSVEVETDAEARPVMVRLRVTPGPAFTLQSFDIALDVPPGEPAPPLPSLAELGLQLHERARAEKIVAAQGAVLRWLAEVGYPLAKVEARRAEVDFATRTMRVTLTVPSGPHALMGPVTVAGLEGLDEYWVQSRVPWREGDVFSSKKIEDLRKTLVESRLFRSVRIETAKAVEAGNLLPITITLTEADWRSVGLGVNWSTNEGLGGQAFWEHRNLFGHAERLRTQLQASEIRTGLDVGFRKPDLWARDHDLVSSFTVEEQRTDAFVTRSWAASAGMDWKLAEHWRASVSGAFERTVEEENDQTTRFTLVSIPMTVRQDTTDDPLDPSRGNRLTAQAQPFLTALGSSVGFTRLEAYDSHYIKVSDQPRIILAGWGRLGTIQGAKADDVPADKRFYVGGGGSVRGFGYQKAGPVDAAGDPIGGRSALAFGGEVRMKLFEDVGIVPFLEGGSAYAQPLPDLNQRLFWGAGLGFRYYTAIGPVRADIAFPLNRRHGVDDAYQIYLSLGQAF